MDFDSLPDDSAPAQAPAQSAQTPSIPPQSNLSFDDLPDDQAQPETSTLGAGAEGLAQGVLGPVAPYLEKKLLHVSGRDILARQNDHPIAHGVGEAAGLIGGAVSGVGEGAALEQVGKLATEATGLANPTSFAAKIGSSAVQQAAEMAILQGSDETAKMVLNDPAQSSQTAIANIGLAAALGGAGGAFITGAVNPLWKATVGAKAESLLKGLTERMGVEGGVPTQGAAELGAKAGIDIPSEYQAIIDRKPGALSAHSNLSQNDGWIGSKYQKNLEGFNDKLADGISETLGRSPKELESLGTVDKYTTGKEIADSLKDELQAESGPISKAYESIGEKFKGTPITDAEKGLMADKISQASLDNGWHKAESSAQSDLADKVIKGLSKQENVDDLKKYITNLRDAHPYGKETYQAAKQISNIIKDSQESSIQKALGPEALNEYQVLKSKYSGLMNKIDNLNEHLHVGRYDGPGSFIKAVDELGTTNGEGVLNRLSGKTKADALNALSEFPQTLNRVKQYHVDSLLGEAVSKASPGSRINVSNLSKNFEKLSPQVQGLVANDAQKQRISAINSIIEGLKDPTHNFSNTARTIHNLSKDAPSALSIVAALMGHGEVGVLTYLGKLGFNEGLPALKWGMLKFLSSGQPIEAEGFKAMTSMFQNVIKGESMLNKGALSVFKPGVQVLAANQMPSKEDRDKLDTIVEKLQNEPDKMAQLTNGKTGHYLPDHQMNLTQTTTQAVGYLQSIKPQPYRSSPLDKEIQPSQAEMSRYARALDIANQPGILFKHIKDGTIRLQDIKDLNSMYPNVYKSMNQKISNAMIHAQDEGNTIPYKTRMGISLFLGQPIDGTMKPMNILAAQPQPAAPMQQNAQKISKKGTGTLGKSNKSFMTNSQAGESDRNTRD